MKIKKGHVDEGGAMQAQYRRIKALHQNEVLFFRVGDFYEMFGEEAVEISALLNLTLTKRGGVPLCGVPWQHARSYIARLLKAGKKVAICEQTLAQGRGIIEREVVEIITPGTAVDEDFLDKESSNYLACLATDKKPLAPAFFSFAYIDLSTGEFHATSFPAEKAEEQFRARNLSACKLRKCSYRNHFWKKIRSWPLRCWTGTDWF